MSIRPEPTPLIPLRDIIVFPHMVVPLFVGREKSIKALEFAMENDKNILLAAQKVAKTDDPMPGDIFEMGTMATILQLLKLPDGTVKVLVEGKHRGRIIEYVSSEESFMVLVDELKDAPEDSVEVEALQRSILKVFETYVKLNKRIPPEMLMSVTSIDDPSRLADTIATHLSIKPEDKQELLTLFAPVDRLEKLLSFMENEIEILEVEQKIRQRVKRQMEKTQKEYYLSEQMKAIQKELGEKDEFKAEILEFEKQIKEKKMPKETKKKAFNELKKLKMMSPMSAEASVVRNYIEWIVDLPWEEYKKEKHDIVEAQKVLDGDHYGLKKVKERIIEHLAVQELTSELKGPILCLVGPPGVGKTSLAQSVAKATGRDFARISLGGVRDEAEIRGHRRTYIGSMPGKILQAIKKAGSGNPLILLDEIDKMSSDMRGDPASAMLEVLDPEQNSTFNDHYLDLDYDLSQVMFLTTANSVQGIPYPLLDRMELISLSGYTEDEKLSIATRFLLPKQIKKHGLKTTNLDISKNILSSIARLYTREAGVRNLERQLAKLCRKVAREVLKKGRNETIKITKLKLEKFLGVAPFRDGVTEKKDEIGVATGLAWTEAGGEMLNIEVVLLPGKGKLTITGKLGDVMQESAQAAMTFIRSRADELGLKKDFYQKYDIHIHVPEGAIPKDGPSAGITMATAIASALTKIPIRSDVAMTGEITLNGKVLPIGGLKEKLLAAIRAGVTTVLIPYENEKNLKEIPAHAIKGLKVILVERGEEVLAKALKVKDIKELFKDQKEEFSMTRAEKADDDIIRH